MAIEQYELIELDVWGNARDGYEVNQAFHTNQFYDIDPDWSDERLVKELKKEELIKKRIHKNSIEIGGDEFSIYFDYKGKPEFELRRKG